MIKSKAKSIKAIAANALVEELQQYFVNQLDTLVCMQQAESSFEAVEWFRDQGLHGGGVRYVAINDEIFNRGSVNVSQVHYDDDETKGLGSATALSTIIHPKNPYVPSVHMHISWTEMKNGKGYWRMMADLNPAIENKAATNLFEKCLKIVGLTEYEAASKQGDRYFYIPALGRQRGVSHFYLEDYNSANEQVDFDLAKAMAKAVIDAYIIIFLKALEENPSPSQQAYQQQQDYHTLYLFQVLTLDRGTTSGLLVHDQNDLGIMGSLPSHINKTLLTTWVEKLEKPQDQLLLDILAVLPDEQPCLVDNKVKLALAKVVREHYQTNPRALAMQAQGDIIPPTVNNHKLV